MRFTNCTVKSAIVLLFRFTLPLQQENVTAQFHTQERQSLSIKIMISFKMYIIKDYLVLVMNHTYALTQVCTTLLSDKTW